MKIAILFWIYILIGQSIFAVNIKRSSKLGHRVDVSQTFSINLPFEITTQLNLPSLNAQYFKFNAFQNVKSNQLYIIHNYPKSLANQFSIENYWKQSRLQTKSFDKNEKNFGCEKLTSRTFSCSRDVGQNGQFLSETLYWNARNDLVLLRSTSLTSFNESRKILNILNVKQNSRLPASNQAKRKSK